MLEFKEKCILTGISKRTSTKTNEEYLLINFLGEDGQTFGCMGSSDLAADVQGLQQLDKVEVNFKVIPGRYTQLKVLSLRKIA